MAFSDLTKQLATEAIRSATAKPAPPPPPPDNAGPAIVAQVQAMQRALKDDEELVVTFHTGAETVRVMEFFFPTWQVAVLTGPDREKRLTRVIVPVESLQLVCKVAKAPPDGKPVRLAFFAPKAKGE